MLSGANGPSVSTSELISQLTEYLSELFDLSELSVLSELCDLSDLSELSVLSELCDAAMTMNRPTTGL